LKSLSKKLDFWFVVRLGFEKIHFRTDRRIFLIKMALPEAKRWSRADPHPKLDLQSGECGKSSIIPRR
jgi:hypothetical protein